MNKSESKYFNTALCMDEALISLLKDKDLEYITVKEICEKAGVNRSTFYLHYETVSDLVNETVETINNRFLDAFQRNREDFVADIGSRKLDDLILITEEYLCPYLHFVRDNKNVYKTAFRKPNELGSGIKYAYLKKHIIEPILIRFDIPNEHWGYFIAYYIEGIMAIIKEWLNSNCRDDVETIAKIIIDCVKPKTALGKEQYEKSTND